MKIIMSSLLIIYLNAGINAVKEYLNILLSMRVILRPGPQEQWLLYLTGGVSPAHQSPESDSLKRIVYA
ncbi:hypothetical protein BZ160_15100 [Pantoea vagans]|nr:hypothetical protein BZ160_15100 [Pantoea vagans]